MPDQRYDRRSWRCVYQIQDTLRLTQRTVLADQARWVQPVLEQLPQLVRSHAHLARAVTRSRYSTATKIVNERLMRQLQLVSRDMQVLNDQIGRDAVPPIPKIRDLLGELEQLENDFGQWDYHIPVNELFVTTEPIRLDGIEFGRFRIRLRLGQPITSLIGRFCWVEALEPHPAACNSDVTHPHVSGDAVCVGDFGPEIIRALRAGRICDFFLMIRSILETYNPDSPYVSLDDWHGEPCDDCGRTMDEDGRYGCEACDRCVCDDCIGYCQSCETNLCFGCLTKCRACEESACAGCLTPCSECGARVCPDCLEDDLCPTCLENRDDEEDEDEVEESCEEIEKEDDASLNDQGEQQIHAASSPCT